MTRSTWFIAVALLGCLPLLAGCGGDSASTAGSSSVVAQTGGGASQTSPPTGRAPSLTPADEHELKAIVLRDATVREVTAGKQVRIAEVIPWLDASGKELVGAEIMLDVRPRLRLVDQRLPSLIDPNHKAPAGTPTLHRYALVSASDVPELRAAVELEAERVAEIEPEGAGAKVTKLELIGPPPKDPAYRPEPGY